MLNNRKMDQGCCNGLERKDGSKRTVKKESTEHANTLGTGKVEINMETIIKILSGSV